MTGAYDNLDDECNDFLSALAPDPLPDDERLITAGFVGDPNADAAHAWRPRPWRPGDELPFHPRANVYISVASFGRGPDGGFRRKNDCFAAGRAIMVDDVGAGAGSKVPYATMAGALPPTAVVETSRGNHQWWYMLSTPERDAAKFGAVIAAFIQGKLLGHDPGMGGIARVGRVPGFTNGKAGRDGWRVRLRELRPEARYTLDELVKAFGLTVAPPRRREAVLFVPEVARERVNAFKTVWRWMAQRGMLKQVTRDSAGWHIAPPDAGGWIQARCPWAANHTSGADTGAALRQPAIENGFYGAWHCCHGSCSGRGFRHLTEWIAEVSAEELAATNDAAQPWEATSTTNTSHEVKQDE